MKFTKITISGKICTGKTTLFWDLQQKLRWTTFSSSQFFRDFSRTHNLSLEKAEEQNIKLTKEVDKRAEDLLKNNNYLIIEGWMAGIVAYKIPGVLKILLICDEQERIKRFAKRQDIDFHEARVKLIERENNWLKKIKSIYGKEDIFDAKYYDLVIDTTNLKPKEILNKVLKKLQ